MGFVEELQAWMGELGMELQLLQLEGGALVGRWLTREVPSLRLAQIQLNKRLHSLGPKAKGVRSISLDLDPCRGERPWRVHGQVLPSDKPGHFAADYRRLFGERPRDTLRRTC